MRRHRLVSRTVDLVLGERRLRFAVNDRRIDVSGAEVFAIDVDGDSEDVVDRLLRTRDDAGWVVVFDEEKRVYGNGDEEVVEVKASVAVRDMGDGIRLRQVSSTTLSSRSGADDALEVARVDADGRPLWRHRVSWRDRGGSRSGPDVDLVTAKDGSAAIRVKGHAYGTSGHDDSDEYDDTLRLMDGSLVR